MPSDEKLYTLEEAAPVLSESADVFTLTRFVSDLLACATLGAQRDAVRRFLAQVIERRQAAR